MYDGNDVLRTARFVRRPLLVAISGKWKEPPDQLIAQQVGFDHYLLKPCDPQQLISVLEALQRADPAPDRGA